MKTKICLLLTLLFIIALSGCASVPETDSPGIHKEKQQKGKKLLFDDWKYKGFGQELPVWFEAAYNNSPEGIKNAIPQLFDEEIVILRGGGINSDQADRNLENSINELSSDYVLYESCWARIEAGEYVALALYHKKS